MALHGGVGIASAATGDTTGTAATATAPTPHFGGGHFAAMHGSGSGRAMPITAAADYLGLSQTDLQSQLQSGKSLADVAEDQGRSVSGLEEAMVAAMKSDIDANDALSADQKSAMLTLAESHVATMVTTAHPDGAGCGLMGHPGRMGVGA